MEQPDVEMDGKKQLERSVAVDAPVSVVYGLFMDNAELANWAPVVDEVTDEEDGGPSGVGCTRTCAVTLDGKHGTLVEKCIEAIPNTRASYLVVDDSFGFNKMIKHYGFTVRFDPAGQERTVVTMQSFYTPANPFVWLMNEAMMKRRFAGIMDALLEGLSQLAVRRHQAAS